MSEETTAADQLTPADKNTLQRFKDKATEFMQVFTRLGSMEDIPPNLQQEYSELMDTGSNIFGTVSWITSSVDSVTGFFSDFFEFDGVQATRDFINGETDQLGIIPLVPIAAVTGAIAFMSKYVSDVYLFERKVTEQKRLVASGISEREAADIVDSISGKGLSANLADIAKPLGFAIGAFVVLRIIRNA